MEQVKITINTDRDQYEAYIKSLCNLVVENFQSIDDKELGNDILTVTHLLNQLCQNLPTQK